MGNPNISMKKTPAMSPYLIVSDVAKAICFYQQAFSFTLAGEPLIENQEKIFVAMAYQDSLLMIGKAGALKASEHSPATIGMNSPVQLHVCVDNVASFYQQAVNQGALVVYPPEVKPWNERTCKLKCPDGHIWCFAETL